MILKKIILQFIEAQTRGWLEEDLPLVKEKITAELPKIIIDLENSISQVCQQASQLQKDGHKGPANYLFISFLYTNIRENNWEYRLDIYDEQLYVDGKECTTSWKLGFIWDCFEQHVAKVHAAADIGIYRNKIRPCHLTEIKMTMAEQYHMATMAFVQLMIEQALQTPAYQNLTKTPNFQISIGEYQDQGMVIYQEQGAPEKIGGKGV